MSNPEARPQPDDEFRQDMTGQLGGIVQREVRRALFERQHAPDPALVAAGWERRFIVDGRRAKEMIELYTEMGYEVHIEPVRAEEFDDECQDCALIALLKFGTIYTRKKSN